MASVELPAKRARVAFTERRAWEIALAAGEPLKGRVHLISNEAHEPFGPSCYEWIEIRSPSIDDQPQPRLRNTLDWIGRARASCVVWHMLSCCEGFGGHENSRFWKKLVDVLARDSSLEEDEETPDRETVSDEHEFFPSASNAAAFPRFRLVLLSSSRFEDLPIEDGDDEQDLRIEKADEWFSTAVREFIGLGTSSIVDSPLQKHVLLLLQLVDEERLLGQAVDISIKVGEVFPLRRLAKTMQALMRDIEEHTQTTPVLERRNSLIQGYCRFPVVALKDFAVDCPEPIDDDEELGYMIDILERCRVSVPLLYIQPAEPSCCDTLSVLLRAMDHKRRKRSAQVQLLVAELADATRYQLEFIFSSIPVTAVETIRINCYEDSELTMDEAGWVWFAYAMYHPWTKSSALKYISIAALDVSEPTAAPLRSPLAAQAAMYRLMHGEDDDTLQVTSTGSYAIVRIRGLTECHRESSQRGHKVIDFMRETTLTAVIKSSVRLLKQLPDYVCVIVPGLGHGFVAKESVIDLVWEATDGSSVSGICLGSLTSDPSMPLHLISPLVKNVSCLDIPAWDQVTSLRLLEVFRTCPAVKHLSVKHRGEVFHEWTDDLLASDPALTTLKLETLEMTCDDGASPCLAPSRAAWSTCLARLSTFAVTTSGDTTPHTKNIQDTLYEGYRVQKFVWNIESSLDPPTNPSHEENYLFTRKMLAISDSKNDIALLPLCERAKLAFASVIKRKSVASDPREGEPLRLCEGNAMARLSPEIAQLICEFASTHGDRIVWVNRNIA